MRPLPPTFKRLLRRLLPQKRRTPPSWLHKETPRIEAWLASSSESQQRVSRSGTTDVTAPKICAKDFFSLLPPRTIASWSLLSRFYRVVCYRYGVYRFNFLYMACFRGSYDTQNCCPNQTDSQTKVKLVSNWYEPKINNLQRQSEKDQ